MVVDDDFGSVGADVILNVPEVGIGACGEQSGPFLFGLLPLDLGGKGGFLCSAEELFVRQGFNVRSDRDFVEGPRD